MKWQDDDLDFDEVSKRIVEWNIENERQLIQRKRNDRVSFKQRHDLDIGWPVHQCEMYAERFRLIGETVESNSINLDKGSFSFEVIQPIT